MVFYFCQPGPQSRITGLNRIVGLANISAASHDIQFLPECIQPGEHHNFQRQAETTSTIVTFTAGKPMGFELLIMLPENVVKLWEFEIFKLSGIENICVGGILKQYWNLNSTTSIF